MKIICLLKVQATKKGEAPRGLNNRTIQFYEIGMYTDTHDITYWFEVQKYSPKHDDERHLLHKTASKSWISSKVDERTTENIHYAGITFQFDHRSGNIDICGAIAKI